MKALLFLIFIANTDPRLGYTDRELEDMRQTKERWRNLANQPIPNENLAGYIHQLGSALSSSATSKGKPNSERGEIYFAIRAKLLSIPGHAEYYRDRINASREAMEAARKSPNSAAILGPAVSDMVSARRDGFATLANLPSVETVRVLGEFLSDDRDAELTEEIKRETGRSPNSHSAVSAISKLGIANPPTPPVRHTGDVTDGMEAWRQWHADVKSGRRTFRFVDDDTEYDLRGAVRRGAAGDRNRGTKRPLIYNGSLAETPASDGKPIRIWPYVIALIFLAAGIWHFIRKRNA